jgi:hypothetical protein
MATYEGDIKVTVRYTIEVEADSLEEAKELVTKEFDSPYNDNYIYDSDITHWDVYCISDDEEDEEDDESL